MKIAVSVILFSMLSFVLTFAVMWLAIVGPQNPFVDQTEEQTLQDLARADSLRAIESKLEQEIVIQQEELQRLQGLADSLKQEIDSRDRIVKKLEQEIQRLQSQIAGVGDERLKMLANIIAGLSPENLEKITENMDVNLLVSIVLNLSPRKAQNVLNAMEPRRAAIIAREMAKIKNRFTSGG
ncbi:MAG: hypothetical protein Q9P90_00120 [candidate division KSB1 bacterium]|nr:hypothetical protein [candidate division KSB1 bacterium]